VCGNDLHDDGETASSTSAECAVAEAVESAEVVEDPNDVFGGDA
jgi:hypothetical protein